MAVAPLITRGFGPVSTIITQGFAPPPTIPSVVAQLQLHGVDASIRTKKDWERPNVKKPWVDTFTIITTLSSVNGEILEDVAIERIDVVDDSSDIFKVRALGNVRVTKTIPENRILIKVSSFFKRK